VEFEAPVDITRVDPVDEDDVDTDESPVADTGFLRRGQTISRYVIVECLGVGGMGIVYSAWDPKLDRKLAIKLVRARMGTAGGTRGRNRLMREAQALACVRHPNVVTVHDVGAHEGRVFVAMEFIEGTTLQQWLEHDRERPFGELLDVFLQAGRGLAAAHRAGLVHRDFKPENVMIGNDGRVVVLDFGIARGPTAPETKVDEPEDGTADEPPTGDERIVPSELIEDGMTRPGAIVGTPSYMSPEQRRRRPLDGRSDQFSYCVALWEALSGERPFGEGGAQKLLARMRVAQFRPMRRSGIPRRVIQALHRGLAWDRNNRFPSMEALLEALNPRSRPPARRQLALVGVGLATVAVLGGMLVGRWIQPELERLEPASCTVDRTRLDELWNEGRAKQIAESLRAGAGESADATWQRGRERIEAWTGRWLAVRSESCEQHLEQAIGDEVHDLRVACLDRELDRFAVVLANLAAPGTIGAGELDGLITLIAELPAPERCTDDAALRDRAPEPESARDRERLAELRAEADRLEIQLRLTHAAPSVEPARQLVAAARELGHAPMRARALLLLGHYLARGGESEEAERVLLEAARAGASAREFEIAAEAIDALAGLLGARGLHDEALRWLELAEGLAGQVGDALHLRVSFAITRATIARRRGDLAAAEAGFEQARALLESDDGPDHELLLPRVLQNLAVVIEGRGDPRRALELHREALAIYERQLGRGRETALARSHLALLQDSLGRCPQARELLDMALAEIVVAAPEGLDHATLLIHRASICDHADESALEHLDRAAAIHERLDAPADRLALRIDRARALLARGRLDEALIEVERAREHEGELAPAPRARLDTVTGLILHAMGRDHEARPNE
jgi:tetratricopeptide (TPR) repeat protein/predicted Ser/Thr protein kinase